MRGVARPAVKLTAEQKRLLTAIDRAIEHAAEVSKREEDKVWALAQEAREAGVPDTQIIAWTGLPRSSFQRRLGPRPENAAPADASE